MKNKTITAIIAALTATAANAELVAHFDMEARGGSITESISGAKFAVEGNFAPENVTGAVGNALRFDGYTSHIEAALGNILPTGAKQLTVSLWVATPSYPIIQIDTDTSEKTPIVSCLNTSDKTGFGFYIGFDGRYSFRTYVGGWPVNIDVESPLPTYKWNNLTAVIDCDSRFVKLYNNGVEVGSSRANGKLTFAPSTFYMGQGTESRMSGPFELMSFNGLIDDISIWDEAISAATIQTWHTDATPDLDIPASRFADDLLRPRFHGMPAAGWTNECHGMYHSDGRFHLFFQKNADGPYMARLHWGHISSDNLYNWREERIAIAPGNPYDIKGCWSGCIFADEAITGNKPNILYTAVDYAKATIAQAEPETDALDVWSKSSRNPIINGRPAGLSDDFRDPYFFRNGDNAYIIVGSSKGGLGTTTLHKYNSATGNWSNDGSLFFTGTSTAQDGSFWEMPNITRMPDGKWLFTATPLGTLQGVRTLYWTGNIDADGHFAPDANSSKPRLVEMNSREGFGLLSPTVYVHEGKTIALGIVPDKLASTSNWKLGWAHCYSLPREWSLGDDGSLVQRPYESLTGLRTNTAYSQSAFTLNGTLVMTPVCGREAEISATFVVGTSAFGFNIFKNSNGAAKIIYNPSSGELIADFTELPRLINDAGIYDGLYTCTLPERPAAGNDLKINLFIDHSIIDIFVNDRWATSIRVFPTDADADGIEAFAESEITVKELKAWILNHESSTSGIGSVIGNENADSDGPVDIYNLSGVKIRTSRSRDNATEGLPAGFYIVGNRKVFVR